MSDSPPFRFYFDYISPNAYLAWTQIGGLANWARVKASADRRGKR